MTDTQQPKDIYVCSRLREEREALGLGQQEIADAVNVSLKTVGRWEKLIAIPSDKLSSLASLGLDVVYILTGTRQPQSEASLTESEQELVARYRCLRPPQQAFIIETVAALAAANGKNVN